MGPRAGKMLKGGPWEKKKKRAVAKELSEQAVCFVDLTAVWSCQPLSQFWTCLRLASLQFVRHDCALEATDSNSELDFTFFSFFFPPAAPCDKKCYPSVCAGGERENYKGGQLFCLKSLLFQFIS